MIQSQIPVPSMIHRDGDVSAAGKNKHGSASILNLRIVDRHGHTPDVRRPVPGACGDEGRSTADHFRVAVIVGQIDFNLIGPEGNLFALRARLPDRIRDFDLLHDDSRTAVGDLLTCDAGGADEYYSGCGERLDE